MWEELDKIIFDLFSKAILIETVNHKRRFIKCALCSIFLNPSDKAGISRHLNGKKHKEMLRKHENNLQSIQKPEITEKAETIGDLKKRLDDELQGNSTSSMFIETVLHGNKFFECTVCSAKLHPKEKVFEHLNGKKHLKEQEKNLKFGIL